MASSQPGSPAPADGARDEEVARLEEALAVTRGHLAAVLAVSAENDEAVAEYINEEVETARTEAELAQSALERERSRVRQLESLVASLQVTVSQRDAMLAAVEEQYNATIARRLQSSREQWQREAQANLAAEIEAMKEIYDEECNSIREEAEARVRAVQARALTSAEKEELLKRVDQERLTMEAEAAAAAAKLEEARAGVQAVIDAERAQLAAQLQAEREMCGAQVAHARTEADMAIAAERTMRNQLASVVAAVEAERLHHAEVVEQARLQERETLTAAHKKEVDNLKAHSEYLLAEANRRADKQRADLVATMQAQLSRIEAESGKADAKARAAAAEIAKLQAALEKTRSEAADRLAWAAEDRARIEADAAAAKRAAGEKQADAEAEAARLAASLAHATEELATTRGRLEEATTKAAALVTERDALASKVAAVTAEGEARLASRVAELGRHHDEVTAVLRTQLAAMGDAHEAAVAAARREAESVRSLEAAAREARFEALRSALQSDHAAETSALQRTAAALQEEVSSLRAEVARLAPAASSAPQWEAEAKSATSRLAAALDEAGHAQAKLATVTAALHAAEAGLEAVRGEASALRNELAARTAEAERLRADLPLAVVRALGEASGAHERELRAKEEAHARTVGELRPRAEAAEAEALELRAKLAASETRASETSLALAATTDRATQAEAALAATKARLATVESQLVEATECVEDLVERGVERRMAAQELTLQEEREAARVAARMQAERFENEIALLQARADAAVDEAGTAARRLAEKEAATKLLQAELQRLETINASLVQLQKQTVSALNASIEGRPVPDSAASPPPALPATPRASPPPPPRAPSSASSPSSLSPGPLPPLHESDGDSEGEGEIDAKERASYYQRLLGAAGSASKAPAPPRAGPTEEELHLRELLEEKAAELARMEAGFQEGLDEIRARHAASEARQRAELTAAVVEAENAREDEIRALLARAENAEDTVGRMRQDMEGAIAELREQLEEAEARLDAAAEELADRDRFIRAQFDAMDELRRKCADDVAAVVAQADADREASKMALMDAERAAAEYYNVTLATEQQQAVDRLARYSDQISSLQAETRRLAAAVRERDETISSLRVREATLSATTQGLLVGRPGVRSPPSSPLAAQQAASASTAEAAAAQQRAAALQQALEGSQANVKRAQMEAVTVYDKLSVLCTTLQGLTAHVTRGGAPTPAVPLLPAAMPPAQASLALLNHIAAAYLPVLSAKVKALYGEGVAQLEAAEDAKLRAAVSDADRVANHSALKALSVENARLRSALSIAQAGGNLPPPVSFAPGSPGGSVAPSTVLLTRAQEAERVASTLASDVATLRMSLQVVTLMYLVAKGERRDTHRVHRVIEVVSGAVTGGDSSAEAVGGANGTSTTSSSSVFSPGRERLLRDIQASVDELSAAAAGSGFSATTAPASPGGDVIHHPSRRSSLGASATYYEAPPAPADEVAATRLLMTSIGGAGARASRW